MLQQQGEGKCLLAASQAAQEAYGLKEHDHSIFTYYLLEGLRGNEKSVDVYGNVTPYSLGSYVYRTILNLPPKRRPKQKPITKVETSGDIILAHYSKFAKMRTVDEKPIENDESQDKRNPEQNVPLLSDIDEAIKRIFEEEGVIDVQDCAERLGITRTKVREIISRLGLVK
jgi:uncharacterized caspase-like protein